MLRSGAVCGNSSKGTAILEFTGFISKHLDIADDELNGLNDGLVPLKICMKQHEPKETWGERTDDSFFISNANHDSKDFFFNN